MIRKSNGKKSKVKKPFSDENQLIIISSSQEILEFNKKNKKFIIFISIFRFIEKFISSFKIDKCLKHFLSGIFLYYFIISFNINYSSIEYKDEFFIVGKKRSYLKKI